MTIARAETPVARHHDGILVSRAVIAGEQQSPAFSIFQIVHLHGFQRNRHLTDPHAIFDGLGALNLTDVLVGPVRIGIGNVDALEFPEDLWPPMGTLDIRSNDVVTRRIAPVDPARREGYHIAGIHAARVLPRSRLQVLGHDRRTLGNIYMLVIKADPEGRKAGMGNAIELADATGHRSSIVPFTGGQFAIKGRCRVGSRDGHLG